MTTGTGGITTDTFSDTPSAYVRRIFGALLWRWWWAWLLPIVACFGGAIHDAAWAFVGFMLLFLLYPGLLSIAYYHYAFSPEAVRTLQPRTLTVDASGITVIYTGERQFGPERYTAADISDVETGAHSVVFYLRKPRHHHIAVPLTSVADTDIERFLALCDSLSTGLA